MRTLPLGYAALQSLSRLSEHGDEARARGLALLRGRSDGIEPASFDLPPGPASERARLFALLGLAEQAGAELDAAAIGGWPAAAVLHQAGLYPESQRIVARQDASWRAHPPDSATGAKWRIAHPRPFRELVEAGAREHDVPPALVYAIMQTESRFDPSVTSWAGARGLMQLMPKTAAGVARRAGLDLGSADVLYDPATNVDLGVRHLGELLERHGGGLGAAPLAIASYNAGAGAVQRWLEERPGWDLDLFVEAIPYDETRRYTQSVLGRLWTYAWLYDGDHAALVLPRTLGP
jgi:soluble lytic murein transglycosylase